MLTGIDNMFLVKDILDRMVPSADLEPLLSALADDVDFTVVSHGGRREARRGKSAVLHYFEDLGDLVTFWRASYSRSGPRIVVQVEERFTIQPAGLASDGAYTLHFDLRDGSITRFLVEESPAIPARWI